MSMEDFAAALEASFDNLVTNFSPGQKVTGTIVSISKNSVFVDVNSTSEGVINREEVLDEEGNVTVSVGDEVEAFYLDSEDGGINLTVKMSGAVNAAQLEDAYANGIPVEGKVMEERKGGFSVKIAGESGFCPYSQMTLHRVEDNSQFVGNTFPFLISEYSGRNLVVSRRKLLEAEREKQREELQETLAEGDLVTGTVRRVMHFGAFVDLGATDGFIPVSELAWSKTDKPTDFVKEGDVVEVKVIGLDWGNNKITLSFRSAQSPWESLAGEYPLGTTTTGKITRLEAYGAFAKLSNGLEGLIHISKFGTGKRVNHPRDVVSVGEEIEVIIDSVDHETKKIALARSTGATSAADLTPSILRDNQKIEEGLTLKGIVDGITDFGVFVKLNTKTSGLLHISEVTFEGNSKGSERELNEMFTAGDEIEVYVNSIKGSRISLSTLANVKEATEMRAAQQKAMKSSSGNDLGSLGGMFDGLDL